jgi:hypothetical protein
MSAFLHRQCKVDIPVNLHYTDSRKFSSFRTESSVNRVTKA